MMVATLTGYWMNTMPSRPELIALAGLAGCGKDSAADYLQRATGYRKIAFADPIREVAARLYDLTEAQMSDRSIKEITLPEWGLSPREIMQSIGDFGRSIHPDTWIRALHRRIETQPEHSGWIITDVRMPREIASIRDHGGEVWWVERQVQPVAAHATENSISVSDCDRVLDNTGTLDQLQDNVLFALAVPAQREADHPSASHSLSMDR